jgi:hypothetical protein
MLQSELRTQEVENKSWLHMCHQHNSVTLSLPKLRCQKMYYVVKLEFLQGSWVCFPMAAIWYERVKAQKSLI